MAVASSALPIWLQGLSQKNRVLVLGLLLMARSEDSRFTSVDIDQLNESFRLPRIANAGARLSDLRIASLAEYTSGTPQRWSLTPRGEAAAHKLLEDVPDADSFAQLPDVHSALFAATEYPTLDPALAPRSLWPGIRDFLAEFPFERNVFLMTRFPTREEADPIAELIETARRAIADHGLALHVAFDRAIVDDVWSNIGAHMWGCRFGLGLLETTLSGTVAEDDDPLDPATLKKLTLNDNVLLELGSMLTLGRRCKILKDSKAPRPPSDLTSQIYREIDVTDLATVESAIAEWVTEDLLIR